MTLKLIFTTNTSQSLKNKQKIPGEEGERGFKSMKDIKWTRTEVVWRRFQVILNTGEF